MKILLLGKDGQVGTELRRTLLPLGFVTPIGRSELNLEDLSGLNNLLNIRQPDIIVNAAAYTAVDKAETDKQTAFLINANVAKILADYAHKHNALLVHYSTDYVFDGKKTGAYLETDPVNPLSVYGASKQAGEEAIVQSGCNHLIFRTSWVFSVSGKNFIKTILRLAKEQDSLRIVSDQYGTPTSAELIADVTALAISRYELSCKPFAFCHPREGSDDRMPCPESNVEHGSPPSWGRQICNGIYHLSASGKTNWYDLACYTVNKALANGIKLNITSRQIHAIATADYPLPAMRPKNSTLNISALSNTLNLQIPDWTVYVDRVIDELTQLERAI